ncbi:MAG: LptA/OstA family protein, partial [Candidatus Acidiferrales bacterium]
PRLLTASGGVTLNSTSLTPNRGTRRVRSDALEIHFSRKSLPRQTLIESVNSLGPAEVDWQNTALMNGKPAAQSMRMNGKVMNLKFGPQNQLRELDSSGGVEVTRKLGGAPEETTASRDLTARFSSTGEWSTIDQVGDVRFRDGLFTGQAARAHADRSANTVTLNGSVVFSDATTRTTAESAAFSQDTNTLRAGGHVLTTDLSAAASGAGRISDFAAEPAHISADGLTVDTTRGRAVYSGNGRLWQGQSVIQADRIELDNATHLLVATGDVRGVFPEASWSPRPGQSSESFRNPAAGRNSGGPKSMAMDLGQVQGGKLTYWEEDSKARIEQNASAISEQASIHADQIDLFFSSAGSANGNKELSRAVASGDVAVRQQDRRGTSNRAEYTAAEGKFVLSEGNPTLYSSTGDTTTGRQLTFYFADDRIVVDSADGSKTVTLHQVEK